MKEAAPINDSVGRSGRNHRHDVLVVQMLLNNHIAAIGPRARLSVDGCCGSHTMAAIFAYQRRELHETEPHGVIYPHSRTLRRLLEVASVKQVELVRQVHKVQKLQKPMKYPVANVDEIAPLPHAAEKVARRSEPAATATPGVKAHLYTDSPLEMVKTATTVDPLQLPGLLQAKWPGLNTEGARVITSQYMEETTNGKSCWNYNLGNVKCNHPDKQLHQYAPGTWEVVSLEKSRKILSENKNARYGTPKEIGDKVKKEQPGTKVVFFKPPDSQTCFAAYKTLDDGVTAWTGRYKMMEKRYPGLLASLNQNDIDAVAKTLKRVGYYSQSEDKYAQGMKAKKKVLDKALGKAR